MKLEGFLDWALIGVAFPGFLLAYLLHWDEYVHWFATLVEETYERTG